MPRAEAVFRITRLLAESRTPLTLSAVTRETRLPMSTVRRMLEDLSLAGVVYRTVKPSGYVPGPHLVAIAALLMAGDDPLRRVGLPVLQSLVAATEETASILVRRGQMRVCIESVESVQNLRSVMPIGSVFPLYQGASGKVLCAWSSERDEEIADAAVQLVPTLWPTRTRFLDAMREIRENGYAISHGERERAVSSVAAPVFNTSATCVAAISVSGPTERISESVPRIVALTRDGAAVISSHLFASTAALPPMAAS
jgi:DNA-binding IclR family transcriptional regulator